MGEPVGRQDRLFYEFDLENIKEYQADNSIKSRFLPVRSVGQAVLWADGAQDSGAIG